MKKNGVGMDPGSYPGFQNWVAKIDNFKSFERPKLIILVHLSIQFFHGLIQDFKTG